MIKVITKILASNIYPLISFQLSSFVLPWLITIWYTYNLGLPAAGDFSFALALISPLCILFAAPSRNLLLTEIHAVDRALQCRIFLLLIGLIISIIIGLYFGSISLITTLYLLKITELLFDLPISIAIKKENIKKLWIINILKWLIITTLCLLSLLINSIEIILLIGASFFLGAIVFSNKANSETSISWPLKTLILKSLPLGISALIFSIHFNIPKYILGLNDENDVLAIYSISSFLVMGAIVLVNIFVQSKLPLLKNLYINDKNGFNLECSKIAIIVCAIFFCMQPTHLPIFVNSFWGIHNNVQSINESFVAIYHQIILFAWGPIIFSLANYVLIITGHHNHLLKITTINAILTLFLCFIGYHLNGVPAIIWAYNIGCMFQCIATFKIFRSKNKLYV